MSFLLRPFVAHRALGHPLWWAALLVLLVNDHLLKGAGVLPGWLTGKLSDVAGLFVAPALVAALLRLDRRGAAVAHLAVGAGFAAIKVCPPAARALEALTALGPLPWRIWCDPGDLLALPALVASWRWLMPLARADRELAPVVRSSALLVASFGCVATSAPEREPFERPPSIPRGPRDAQASFPPVSGSLGLANDSGVTRLVRVRPLLATVEIDCDLVASAPGSFLDEAFFGPAESWLLEDGRILGLGAPPSSGRRCDSVLVEADGLDPALVFWGRDGFPWQSLPSFLGAADSTRTLRLTGQGEQSRLQPHPTVASFAASAPGELGEECSLVPAASAIAWSEPLPTSQLLTAVSEGADGCTALTSAERTTYLCGLHRPAPFVAGDVVFFESGSTLGVRVWVPTESATPERAVWLGYAVWSVNVGEARPIAGCPAQPLDGGGRARPIEVSAGGEAGVGGQVLRPGQVLDLPDGSSLSLRRSLLVPAFDRKVNKNLALGVNLEWSQVWGTPPAAPADPTDPTDPTDPQETP